MADFPSIRPASRTYSAGQFPLKTYRALSGATVKRVFGNKAYGHSIELQFTNITDAVAKQIIDHYYGQNGSVDRFALPSAVFSGMSEAFGDELRAPDGISWEYAEPPVIEAVFNGISSVTVRLIGELS